MRLASIIAVAGCVACGPAKTSDPCANAYHVVQPLAFGGATYAGPPALMFGMVCPDLTVEDFQCIINATTKDTLKTCSHAMTAISERVAGEPNGPAPQSLAADFTRIADAVCACPDTDCILHVGQREHAFEIPRKPLGDSDPAKAPETRLKDCLKAAKPPAR
jgi:hypothetical protein